MKIKQAITKILAILQLIRPVNILVIALTTFFGIAYHTEIIHWNIVIPTVLVPVFIAAGGFAINDFFDLQIDKANKISRPLVTGKLSINLVYGFSICAFIIGIICTIFIKNIEMILLAGLNAILLYYYAKSWKKIALLGNFIVSFACACTFMFGAFANSNLKNVWIISILAFFYTFIRELVKDAEDIEGDRKYNAKTLPIIIGNRRTIIFSIILCIPIFFFSYLGFHLKLYDLFIFLAIIMFILFSMYLLLHLIIIDSNKKDFHRVQRLMKLNILLSLIILWIGQWGHINI